MAMERIHTLMSTNTCNIGPVTFGSGRLAVIAGPCVAESLDICMQVAKHMVDVCRRLDIGYVFKASYDKANRSSVDSYRGPGLRMGLDWLGQVRAAVGVPVVSDVHDVSQVAPAAEVLDCVQIPAFLCRQTDLLVAAGQSGKCVNIKKGQFMAPDDMKLAVDKVRSTGNDQILLTERGTFFGYNRLVSDMRGLLQMRQFAPVIFDATHSVQEPGGLGNASGGKREFAGPLAQAALAAGADAIFLETHPEPDKAKSDAASQVALKDIEPLLRRCLAVFNAAHSE